MRHPCSSEVFSGTGHVAAAKHSLTKRAPQDDGLQLLPALSLCFWSAWRASHPARTDWHITGVKHSDAALMISATNLRQGLERSRPFQQLYGPARLGDIQGYSVRKVWFSNCHCSTCKVRGLKASKTAHPVLTSRLASHKHKCLDTRQPRQQVGGPPLLGNAAASV